MYGFDYLFNLVTSTRTLYREASREASNFSMRGLQERRMRSKMESVRDIMFNILSRVPLKSVIKFSCVSKDWFDMINDPDFGELHSYQTPTDPGLLIFLHRNLKENTISINPLILRAYELQVGDDAISHLISSCPWSFIGTCNGLLCFTSFGSKKPILVCNPLTEEFITLPEPTTTTSLESCEFMFGFGFDSSTKKYKVVRVVCPKMSRMNDPSTRVKAQVYTLGGIGGWRAVQDFQYCPYGKPVYANGALHWVVNPSHGLISKKIISFDLTTEEFKRTSHPKFGCYVTVSELGGQLAVVDLSSRNFVEVWIMKGENDWNQEYIIPVHKPRHLDMTLPRLVAMIERDGVLLIWLQDNLLSYDKKTFRLRDLKISGLPTWLDWDICSGFRGSLVRLNNSCVDGDNGRNVFFIRDTDFYSWIGGVIGEQKVVGRCDGIVACFAKNGMLLP